MTIAFYVSAHGFGHSVRTAQIIRQLPPQIPALIRSTTPRWFFDQELTGRPYELEPERFDVGTLGPDSVGIDLERTFEQAGRIHQESLDRLDRESEFLRERGVRVVVCDAPAPPLVAAKRLGIPGLLLANFTWVEIYAALAGKAADAGKIALAGEISRLVEDMRTQFRRADAHLIPGLAVEMTSVERTIPIPIVARHGQADRAALADVLGFDPERPIMQVYLGTAGLSGIDWHRLETYVREQFFSFTPVPGDEAAMIRIMPEGEMAHADATASVDAVVGKLGYSLCAECLASGIPIIYSPREDFAEFPALETGMKESGLGVALTPQGFKRLEWRGALKRAREARAKAVGGELNLPATDGAEVAASLIAETWRTGNLEHLG